MPSRALTEVKAMGYGARPVSVDTARGRTLSPTDEADGRGQGVSPASRLPFTHQVVADRLSLAHWPPGHQVVVCALSGGTGRTTMAGLMATVLAELPFAHFWHPIALIESAPRTLSSTQQRWESPTRRVPTLGPFQNRRAHDPGPGLSPAPHRSSSGGPSPCWWSTPRPGCPRT